MYAGFRVGPVEKQKALQLIRYAVLSGRDLRH